MHATLARVMRWQVRFIGAIPFRVSFGHPSSSNEATHETSFHFQGRVVLSQYQLILVEFYCWAIPLRPNVRNAPAREEAAINPNSGDGRDGKGRMRWTVRILRCDCKGYNHRGEAAASSVAGATVTAEPTRETGWATGVEPKRALERRQPARHNPRCRSRNANVHVGPAPFPWAAVGLLPGCPGLSMGCPSPDSGGAPGCLGLPPAAAGLPKVHARDCPRVCFGEAHVRCYRCLPNEPALPWTRRGSPGWSGFSRLG